MRSLLGHRPLFKACIGATAGILLALNAGHVSAADERPNVVVILADDQGWGDLSINGNTNLATPNIDSLARDGALFEHFYVCPVCSPTRAEFLTGRYHPRGGVFSTSTGGERLDLDETTIAESFQAAGYATGAFGKWHNGTQYPYHPNARGFGEFYGFCSGHWGHYFDPILEHNGQTVRGKGFIADDLTDHAITFIEANRGRPFFCYLPFNTPHSPMQVPDRFFEKFSGAELKLRCDGRNEEDVAFTRAALAMCENIDWNVGRVLAKLDELKLADNTIVVYFSDNGPNGWRWNGGMKGRKASTDEGGVRSPLLIRWPDYIAEGLRIKPIAAAIDLLPTLADLAEIKIVGDKPLDGRSLAPLLLLTGDPGPPRTIYSHWSGKVSLRTDRYRFDDSGKLFDMLDDPGQLADVAADHPDVAARLRQDLDAWKRDVLSELKTDQRPFTVGYKEFPTTVLPARDAIPHGNILRSARAPNCSYLRNWTSTDDSITWDVDVHTVGKYRAVLYYTCPQDDVGAEVELSFGDHRAQAKVTKAFDPPLVGAQQDRVPRVGESLVKEFAPLEFTPLELPAGRGTLTLRALSMPGKQATDVRGLSLTLTE
jgi:arylsulfatase A-like enzyme